MTLPKIDTVGPVPLRPLCASRWLLRCEQEATYWLVAPDGDVVGEYCEWHVEQVIEEYADKLGELWTKRLIEVLP